MKKILLSCLVPLLLTTSLSTKAQSDFQEGYIVKNDNKLVSGLIKFTGDDYTPSECVFKWFDISQSITYSPEDIKSFGFINGGRFESARLDNKRVFITCLVKGKVNLLYDGKTIYVENAVIGITPLTKRAVQLNLPEGKVKTTDYKDLLNKLLTNTPSFSIPDNIALNTSEIKDLIVKYNVSSKSETRIFTTNKKDEFYTEMQNIGAYTSRYGVIGGVNATRIFATAKETYISMFIPEMTFYEYTPVAGIFFNHQLNRSKEKIMVQAELLVFRNSIYIYNEANYGYGHDKYRSDITISYTGIKVPLFIQANLFKGKGKIIPFINMGIFYTKYLGGNYTRVGEYETATHIVRPFEDNSLHIKSQAKGIMLGGGVKYKINAKNYLFLDMRAEFCDGIFTTKDLSQHISSFNILGGYNF